MIAMVVSIATFMEVLDTTIANVALRHIAGSLAADQDESTWILTSYLVSNAIVLPVSGWLANVIGRKRFYMICVGLFTFSSLLCAMSTSLGMMLCARVLQGIGGGGMAPTEQSMFADTFAPEKRAQAFALYGLTVVSAPAIGPVLGGWLTDNLSWHWVFLINLPVGLLSLTLVGLLVVEPEVLKRERKELLAKGLNIDVLGLILVVLGFGALQILLDRYELDDGFSSGFISTLGVISGGSLLGLVAWELFHPQPVVDVRLMGHRSFGICCGLMFLVGFLLISTTQLLPQLAQTLLGYDATTSGMTLAVGGIVTLFVMPISGVVTGRLIQAEMADPDGGHRHRLVDAGGIEPRPQHQLLEHLRRAHVAGGMAAVPVHPAECGVLCRSAARPQQRSLRPDQPDAQPGWQRRCVLRYHDAGGTNPVPSCSPGGAHHRVQRVRVGHAACSDQCVGASTSLHHELPGHILAAWNPGAGRGPRHPAAAAGAHGRRRGALEHDHAKRDVRRPKAALFAPSEGRAVHTKRLNHAIKQRDRPFSVCTLRLEMA
jgi:MFS family permease